MSGAGADAHPGQGEPMNGLHVTAVKVHFPSGRPDGKLELAVKLNNEERKLRIDEDTDAQWSGNIYCPLPSTARVCVRYCRHIRWREFAVVQAPLCLELSSLSDPAQRIHVAFTISESTTLSKVKATQDQLKNKQVLLDKLEKFRSVLTHFETAKEALSDIHPAVGAAMSAVGFLIKACERQEACRDETLELIEQLEPFLLIDSRIKELKEREETRRAVGEMLHLIGDISDYIRNKTSSGLIGFLLGDGYQEKLGEMKKAFTKAKDDFDRSIQLEVLKAVDDTQWITQLGFLHEKLSECEEAHYKSGEGNTCLEGTRLDLRERTMRWVDEDADGQPRVFWLRGKAGSGKSTVANTIARTLDNRNYNLSCFFCKRDDQNLSDPRRVLSTLAYRFAQQHDSYRTSLYQLFHTGTRGAGIAATADVDTQFEKLFKEPLATTVEPPQPHVVIIDALDECASSKDQTSLAKCIVGLSRLAPWIKVFVTSRDEPAIRKVLIEDVSIRCNINEEECTDDDIRQYINTQAESLELELSDEDVGQLVRRAQGLFIWCSTLFKYLCDRTVPRVALTPFLSGAEQHGSWTQLSQLYDRVLDSAASHPEDVKFMRTVLSIINVASSNRPLSTKAIASFMNDHEQPKEQSEQQIQAIVSRLHAVLYVDRSTNGAIRAYHTSFYDFLQQKAMDVSSGWERSEAAHSRIFRCCLGILNAQLRFNVCGIEKPILNKDVPDLSERIKKNISEELQYSSRYWFTHLPLSNLAQSNVAPGVQELLCSKKLLFWLEALSLQGLLMQYSLAFAECSSFFQEYPDIVAAANDAHRFIAAFSEAMDSVPHIYLSSLFWLPQDSPTYRNLELSELPHLQITKGKRNHWDAVIWERSVAQALSSVEYSPNGQYVACGASDGRVYILNARTGTQEEEPLQGHSERVTCLTYSPNGQFIASGSRDKTVRIWDTKSGEPVFALVGHTGWVRCVAWSPSGQFIASSSDDGTIRIWNTRTGTQEGKPLRGHKGSVCTLAYAPGGTHIASGGEDASIRVWSINTYQKARKPFSGYSLDVWSIGYSPDGRTIVSGSRDCTVRIWNAQTGEAIGQPLRGHANWVLSVVYSPNGQFIVSGSNDCMVRVWDAASGAPVGELFRGHTNPVNSVSCSPDGLSIASASGDGTICIREMPTGSRAQDQSQGYDEPVLAVAFSPNGQHIASGSKDGAIHLWNAETGASIGQPLREEHEGQVTSVAYSPDGQSIASGSTDNTCRVWSVNTDRVVSGEPLRGHSGSVLSVAYSPNGSLIASASSDGTVRLWDARNGSAIGEPLPVPVEHQALSTAFSPDGRSLACGTSRGSILVWEISSTVTVRMTLRNQYSRRVGSVAFSPDGRYIASVSWGNTVQLWDARTGMPHGSPCKGHTDHVLCVVFSPNSRFVASSSRDRTVRLWDAQTGLAVGDPLRGHSYWVNSVAFSPDGRFLTSAGSDTRICVYTAPSAHSSQVPGDSEVAAHWLACCSCVNEQDGWVKDGDNLLLWVPPPYRQAFRSGTRFVISKSVPMALGASSVDYETLFRYSGTKWINILSDL